jgi:ubiquinone/menaquinone biosynthesis C-methylase UbiE
MEHEMHQLHTRGRTISWAAGYDVLVGWMTLGQEAALRQMTVELAQVKPGDQVLDVGCGTGSLTIAAKKAAGPAGEVHGIDPAPQMIELARRKAVRAGAEVNFQVGLIEDIPYPEGKFDLVLSSLMLHHLPDDLKRKGFSEVHRVLKPGGRFVAVDFDPPTRPPARWLAALFFGHGMLQSNLRTLEAMLQSAGFIETQTGKTRYGLLAFLQGTASKNPATVEEKT